MTVSTVSIERRNAAGDLENVESVSGTVTVGIVRDADSVVILAPTTTGITNPSTGSYSYSYAALLLDSTKAYTLTWTFTVGSFVTPITAAISAYSTRRSLREYRRALVGMNQLGPWSLVNTSAMSAAADQLVIATLADSDLGPSSNNAIYAYIADGALAGQQRRVKQGGFASTSGTLTVSRAYSGVPAANVEVELLHKLPAIRDELGRVGLREIINWAIEQCPQVIRLDFTGVAGQQQYSLENYPWLTSTVQIGPAYQPALAAGRIAPRNAGGARLSLNAELPQLELDSPFSTGETFSVDLLIPGDRWIRTGGAWGQSDVGLVDDDDEALVDRRLVEQAALAYAYRALAGLTEPRESDFWAKKADAQEQRAAWLRFWSAERVADGDTGAVRAGGRGGGISASDIGRGYGT